MKGTIVKADAAMLGEMKRLWKETFHDSDAYVNMFFTNCFTSDYSLVYIEDNRIRAMLLGVPFRFGGFGTVADDYRQITNMRDDEAHAIADGLKGLYLCGLATEPESRRQGIMSQMIENVNCIASNDGFDFTFLIPADAGLSDYYAERGYVKAIYRNVSRFSSNHDFHTESLECLSTAGYDSRLMYKVYDLIIGLEKEMPWMTLSHTVQEIDLTFEDCRQSGGKMFYVLDRRDNTVPGCGVSDGGGETLKAVTFAYPANDREVVLPHLYYRDVESMRALLDGVKREFPTRELVLYSFPETVHRKAIWNPFFEARDVAALPDVRAEVDARVWYAADHSESYGMIRLLQKDRIVKLLEMLSEIAYSAKSTVVKSEDGKLRKLQKDVIENLQSFQSSEIKSKCEDLSLQRLAEIVFRRNSHDDMVGLAYGIPRLPLNMAYMLD